MPITTENLTISGSFSLSATTPFGAVTTPAGTALTFSMAGINVAVWNQVYAATYTIFVTVPQSLSVTMSSGGTLVNGTTYYYKVSGVGPNGPLSSNTIESGASGEASGAATASNGTANLSWTALQGAASYNVYRGTSPGGENLLVGNTTSTSFVDNGIAGTSQSPPGTPATYVEFPIYTFTNLVGESVTTAHALGLVITATGAGANCALAPGQTNGLTWFFSGTTPAINLPVGGGTIVVCGQGTLTAASGTAVNNTTKTLRVTNSGSGNLTFSVLCYLSTQ